MYRYFVVDFLLIYQSDFMKGSGYKLKRDTLSRPRNHGAISKFFLVKILQLKMSLKEKHTVTQFHHNKFNILSI